MPPLVAAARTRGFRGQRSRAQPRLKLRGAPFQRARLWDRCTRDPLGRDAELWRAYGGDRPTGGGARRQPRQQTNPVAIAVPCHRVIGADRALTGWQGGQAEAWLLRREGAAAVPVVGRFGRGRGPGRCGDACRINPSGRPARGPPPDRPRCRRRRRRAVLDSAQDAPRDVVEQAVGRVSVHDGALCGSGVSRDTKTAAGPLKVGPPPS